MLKSFLCIVLIVYVAQSSQAQPAAIDSSSGLALQAVSFYYETLGEQSPLYNGREYIDYARTIHSGHPFLYSTEPVQGTIHFDGMVFQNAMLLYDIIKDKVILQHFNKSNRIDLPARKIEQFMLMGHNFIRLWRDSANVIEEGFYDRIYQGKVSLFVKRRKRIREERAGTEINNVIDEVNLFYIQKQGMYRYAKNLRMLFNILGDNREKIQQYLKKNGIKFKNDPEKAMMMAVEYYDRLSN